MERFGRFTILEALAQGRIRSYRAWDPVAKQVAVLHLGWDTDAEIPALPPESFREKGTSDNQAYLLTADLPQVQDLNAAAKPSPMGTGGAEQSGGEFTRMFRQWQEPGAAAGGVPTGGSEPAAPQPKPASPPIDPDATRLMPAPRWTPEMAKASQGGLSDGAKPKSPAPPIVKQIIRVGPSRAKVSDQISNPALSLPDATVEKPSSRPATPVSQPGEFTRAFQTQGAGFPPTPKPAVPAQKPAGEFTQLFAEPLPASAPQPLGRTGNPAPPIQAAPKDPGEFTQLFQQSGGPAEFKRPVPPAPPPDNTGKDLERLFQSPLPDSGPEIDFDALDRRPIQKSAPPPKAAGAFTEIFGHPLSVDFPRSPPERRSPMENANATVLFEAPARPAPRSDPAHAGDFTQEFGRPSTGLGTPKAAVPETAAPAPTPTPTKIPVGALILIGAALIVIVVLLFLFLLLRR